MWRFSSPLMVPAGYSLNWRGWIPISSSIEHYYHFLLGYLLPVVDYLLISRGPLRLLDCGPLMDPILEETLDRLGVASKRWNPLWRGDVIELPRWDEQLPALNQLTEAVAATATAWKGTWSCRGSQCRQAPHLLLDRSATHPYYVSARARIPTYGVSRRAINNVDSISVELSELGVDHLVYAPGEHTLGCQIDTFRGAQKISGIRGAEWANLVWLSSGIDVRVVFPDDKPSLLPPFISQLGHRLTAVDAHGTHIEDSAERIAEFFATGPKTGA